MTNFVACDGSHVLMKSITLSKSLYRIWLLHLTPVICLMSYPNDLKSSLLCFLFKFHWWTLFISFILDETCVFKYPYSFGFKNLFSSKFVTLSSTASTRLFAFELAWSNKSIFSSGVCSRWLNSWFQVLVFLSRSSKL